MKNNPIRILINEKDANKRLDVVLAEKLKKIAKPRNILLTLGSEGLLICHGTDPSGDNTTDRIPALNNYPKDPAGAGDSLLVSAAMSLAVGADIWSAAYIASLVSATQVSRIGNVPITKPIIR